MNENCIEALFMKSRQSFYYDMAYDSQSDMFTSLEMFSSCDANNPTSPTSIHQVNCTGTPIYSSLNQVAPPSEYNTNLASIITSTSDCITSKQDKTTKALDLNRTSVKLCGVGTSNNSCLDDVDSRTDSTNVNLHEQIYRDQYTLRRSGLKEPPIVVITPASALDSESEMDTRDPNAHNENGEFIDGGCLNDGIDSCSLSSACSEDRSEDDIPTDDDPSESDSAQQPDEKIRKTSTSNWKKIRRVIHWSPFVQNFKRKYPWVQLAGHQGSFKAGEDGNILKKTSEKEKDCLIKLMKDILRPYVPEYKREVQNNGENYIEMQDLLQEFENPCIMDCKMGVRTYLEEEIAKAKSKPRKDLYQKMVDIDPSEPTESEHIAKAITKPRYMQWRERLSSSATLGFRIEGIKNGDSKPNKDFKKTKTIEDVAKVFTEYIENDAQLRMKYLRRLKAIRATLEASCFFRTHELIGSSLLFVHDSNGAASIWMIDFGKTVPLPDDVAIDHRSEWKEGNHEDGYLWGLDKMIEVWTLK